MTDPDLVTLAHWQWKLILSFRWLLACDALTPLVGLGFLVMVVVVVQAIKRSYRLSRLLFSSKLQCAAIASTMVIPLMHIVFLIMLINRSYKVLKAAGRSETFFVGVKPQSGA